LHTDKLQPLTKYVKTGLLPGPLIRVWGFDFMAAPDAVADRLVPLIEFAHTES